MVDADKLHKRRIGTTQLKTAQNFFEKSFWQDPINEKNIEIHLNSQSCMVLRKNDLFSKLWEKNQHCLCLQCNGFIFK